MNKSAEYRAYEYAMEVLASDETADFEQLKDLVETFPHGVDDLLGRRWIRNAIEGGSMAAVKWMLDGEVDLAAQDDDGYTPLHAAVERDLPNKYEIIESLLRAGAPVNAIGIDNCTPAHFAAVRDDVEALRLFAKFGADFSVRSAANGRATPLEEALRCNSEQAIRFLQGGRSGQPAAESGFASP